MLSLGTFAAILQVVTLAIASPTTSLEATDSRHLIRQVTTATSLTLPSIPTITIDILQPPSVSLHSITARDAQTPEPTTTTPPQLGVIVPVWTVTLEDDWGTSLGTCIHQITNVSSALYRWTEVPVASSASCLTRETNSTPTEWNCTAICGTVNENSECSKISACVKMDNGNGKGGRPPWSNSAGRMTLCGHMVVTVMILVSMGLVLF